MAASYRGVVALVAVGLAAILWPRVMASDSTALQRAGCAVDRATLTAPGCALVGSDTSVAKDPARRWGEVACQQEARQRLERPGGDRHPTAKGAAQRNRSYRRLAVVEGDNVFGQRCELGRNEHQWGQGGGRGTFELYREGQRKITFASYKILHNTPMQSNQFQTVMQIKQTQPADNGGSPPMLALNAQGHQWVLRRQSSPGPGGLGNAVVLWSAPAKRGVWTRVALDVIYSQSADVGKIKLYLDRNGDGDARDRWERSPTFTTPTLKYETPDPQGQGFDVDGLAPGDSIPSHLRVGLYHHDDYDCSTITRYRCAIAVDNVQVVAPR